MKIVPDIDESVVRVTVDITGNDGGYTVYAEVLQGGEQEADANVRSGDTLVLPIRQAELWAPDHSTFYDLLVTLQDGNSRGVDTVESYFGMRKIALGKNDKGVTRLMLNNESLFQFGPLDQRWWPDSLYTAASDEALRFDVEATKLLGFNMARKHVKIEPARWYYWWRQARSARVAGHAQR